MDDDQTDRLQMAVPYICFDTLSVVQLLYGLRDVFKQSHFEIARLDPQSKAVAECEWAMYQIDIVLASYQS